MKKYDVYFLTLFFVILLAVPIYWLTKGETTTEESLVEARTLVALQPKSSPNLQRALDLIEEGKIREAAEILINLFTSKSFVNKFEQATSDQIPLRMAAIRFSKFLDRGIIDVAYSFVSDPIVPADMTNEFYFDAANNQLLHSPTFFNEDICELIDERIRNYEDLIQSHPEQKFYIYYYELLHNSEFHPMNQYFTEANEGQSIAYFEDHLPEGLTLEKFLLTSLDDHLKYYYRTDHHWTVYGILHAYEEIYEMIAQDYPEISPMLEYEDIVEFPEIEFLGYMARRTFYPIDGDKFLVEIINIPSHEIIASGQEVKEDPRQAYFEGEYSMIPFTNHFNEFYGNVTDLIEYTFNNDSDRNLLIFGSSFRNALDPLLASHYKKTYCVDLRYFTDFSLSGFLAEHDVDDILVVGDNDVLFQDFEYWKINP